MPEEPGCSQAMALGKRDGLQAALEDGFHAGCLAAGLPLSWLLFLLLKPDHFALRQYVPFSASFLCFLTRVSAFPLLRDAFVFLWVLSSADVLPPGAEYPQGGLCFQTIPDHPC